MLGTTRRPLTIRYGTSSAQGALAGRAQTSPIKRRSQISQVLVLIACTGYMILDESTSVEGPAYDILACCVGAVQDDDEIRLHTISRLRISEALLLYNPFSSDPCDLLVQLIEHSAPTLEPPPLQ